MLMTRDTTTFDDLMSIGGCRQNKLNLCSCEFILEVTQRFVSMFFRPSRSFFHYCKISLYNTS